MNEKSLRKVTSSLILVVALVALAVSFNVPNVHAFSNVQCRSNSATSGTSVSITLASAPISGNLLVMTETGWGVTITSISETGVTWAIATTKSDFGVASEIWYGIASGSPSASITVNVSGTISKWIGDTCEYNGFSGTPTIDKTAQNSNAGSTHPDTGTTATTTQANEVWVGGMSLYDGAITQSTPTNGFTLFDATGASTGQSQVYKFVSSTGAADCSTTSASSTWIGEIVTFYDVVSSTTTFSNTMTSTSVISTLTTTTGTLISTITGATTSTFVTSTTAVLTSVSTIVTRFTTTITGALTSTIGSSTTTRTSFVSNDAPSTLYMIALLLVMLPTIILLIRSRTVAALLMGFCIGLIWAVAAGVLPITALLILIGVAVVALIFRVRRG